MRSALLALWIAGVTVRSRHLTKSPANDFNVGRVLFFNVGRVLFFGPAS
jgi:hypothetical protein